MNRFIQFWSITLVVFSCCTDNQQILIGSQTRILIENEQCDIKSTFPVMSGLSDQSALDSINKLLLHFPDIEYYTHHCDDSLTKTKVVRSNFEVKLMTDTMLSIEYRTVKTVPETGFKYEVFHSIVLSPSNGLNGRPTLWGYEPEILFPDFDRGKLFKYVQEHNRLNPNKGGNELAYKSGSGYVITWGLTKNSMILYLGGEGEFHGFTPIEIPLKELGLEEFN